MDKREALEQEQVQRSPGVEHLGKLQEELSWSWFLEPGQAQLIIQGESYIAGRSRGLPCKSTSIGFSTGLQFPKPRDKGVVSVDPQGAAQSLHKKHDHHGVKYYIGVWPSVELLGTKMWVFFHPLMT